MTQCTIVLILHSVGVEKSWVFVWLGTCCLFQSSFVEPKTSNKWTTRSSFEPPLRLSLRFVTWQCAERLKKLYYWSVPSSYWSVISSLASDRSKRWDKPDTRAHCYGQKRRPQDKFVLDRIPSSSQQSLDTWPALRHSRLLHRFCCWQSSCFLCSCYFCFPFFLGLLSSFLGEYG